MLSGKREEARSAVAKWNERIAKYRESGGDKLRKEFFRHHPAFGDMCAILQSIFPISETEEIERWAAEKLSFIGKDEAGGMTFGGKGRAYLLDAIEQSRRSASVAVDNCNFAMAGLAVQNVELGQYLDLLIFEDGPIGDLPMCIKVREANT